MKKKDRNLFTEKELREFKAENKKAFMTAVKIGVPVSIITKLLCELLFWLFSLSTN